MQGGLSDLNGINGKEARDAWSGVREVIVRLFGQVWEYGRHPPSQLMLSIQALPLPF